MRVFGDKLTQVGANEIAKTNPTEAYVQLGLRNVRKGINDLFLSAPYAEGTAAFLVGKDIFASGELTKISSGQDQFAYHHPLNYAWGVFTQDHLAEAVAAVPLVLLGWRLGSAAVRFGQAESSHLKHSRGSRTTARR